MRQLGARLLRLREEADLSPYDVERSKICKRRTLGRYEKGETIPPWPVARELAKFYGADPAMLDDIERMAKEAEEKVWWEPLGVPKWFGLFMELEQSASTVRCYETEYVTGLLQTEPTMRAVLGANPRLGQGEMERHVTARLVRQRQFFGRRPTPRLEVILSEGVVRRVVGGEETHADQMQRLAEIAASPNVDVYVVPFAAGAPPGSGHPFTLMEFEDKVDPPVVYAESALAGRYDDSPVEYTARSAVFDGIKRVSIPIGDVP